MKPSDNENLAAAPEPGPASGVRRTPAVSDARSVTAGDSSDPASGGEGAGGVKEMSLEGHLTELRRVILISLGTLVILTVLCFVFNRPLMRVLLLPAGSTQFIFVAPAESFLASLKVSVLGGFLLSLPVILHQVFWFIEPGLTAREKRYARPLLMAAMGLFGVGVLLAYFVLLPLGIKFLYGFITVDNLSALPSLGHYVDFAATILLMTGLIFELPLLLLFLAVIRLVNAEFLSQYRRHAIVGTFVVAMVVSPSADIFTQCLLAGVLIGLYESSIWLIRIRAPGFHERSAENPLIHPSER